MQSQLVPSSQETLASKLDKPWFDASKINEYRTCPQKFYNRYVKGLQTETESHHLRFGIAVHKSLEHFYKGTFFNKVPSTHEYSRNGEMFQGLSSFLDEYPQVFEQGDKTRLNGLEYLAAYAKKYNDEPFDVVAVEQTFLLDMGTFYYIGRMDLIIRWDGKTLPADHKTASRFGPQFESQFKIDTQITGYIYAVRRLIDPNCNSALIDAIRITKKIDMQESFLRRITTRQLWELEAWEAELRSTVDDIHRSMGSELWPRDGQRCSDYNSICPYYNLCLTHPGGRKALEDVNYRVEHWEPL